MDDRRRGVGGVEVSLVVAGDTLHQTRTAEDGTYRIAGRVPARSRVAYMGPRRPRQCDSVVRAVADDGRAGWRALPLPARSAEDGDLELSAIRLEEAHEITVRVKAEGGPVSNALVRFGGGPADSRSTWDWHGAARTDAAGVAHLTGLTRGTAGLYVTADTHGPAVAGLLVPPLAEDTDVVVTLPPRTSVGLLVREEGTAEPVPNAAVMLVVAMPSPDRGWVQLGAPEGVPETDDSGTTRLPRFAEGTRGWVYVRAPDRPQRRRASHTEVRWDAASLVVEVPGPSSLSWALVAGDGPLPLDGTAVRIRRGDGAYDMGGFLTPETGRIEDARLVVPHAVAQTSQRAYHLLAVLPDGRCAEATVARGAEDGEEVAFRGPRSLTIRVVDAAGRPIAGMRPYVSRCESKNLHDHYPVTDDRGTCLLAPFLPEVVRAHLWGDVDQWIEPQERDVDLTESDGTVEFSIAAPQRLRVEVTMGGAPRLPGSWRLRVGRHRVPARHVREDPIQGTLEATLCCRDALEGIEVRLEAPSYGTAIGIAHLEAQTGKAIVRLALGSSGRILARVAPPSSGGFELFLERYHEEAKTFSSTGMPLTAEAAREGTFVFDELEPGRYRLRERFTHRLSNEVVIPDAGGDASLEFDLSAAGLVRGRIDAPSGYGPLITRVLVAGLTEPEAPQDSGVPWRPSATDPRFPAGAVLVGEDGRFELLVPGDRTITLEAWHPMLRSAGSVEVLAPRSDVRLTLVQGPTASLLLDRPLTHAEAAGLRDAVIHLYRGDESGAPAFRCPAVVSGGKILFGRFEPGTYTVWLDSGRLAPVHLRSVGLGPNTTKIEGVRISPGCRLIFDVLLREDTVRPHVLLHAHSLEGPPHGRTRRLVDAATPTELSALGAGLFRVTVHTFGPRGQRPSLVFEGQATLDGETDTRVTVDLR